MGGQRQSDRTGRILLAKAFVWKDPNVRSVVAEDKIQIEEIPHTEAGESQMDSYAQKTGWAAHTNMRGNMEL